MRAWLFGWCVAAAMSAGLSAALAQDGACTIDIPQPLSFDQWKDEVQTRADRQIYPLIGIRADEVKATLPQITKPDCDLWAKTWMAVGDQYLEKARAAVATDARRADADFMGAWRYYNLARWPTLLSPAKRQAWIKAQEAFAEHGKLMSPPAETIRISYEPGKDIVGVLRMPKQSGPVPFLITVGGLDGWRDDMTGRFAALPENGFGYIAVDAPGTGDSPVKGAGTDADRMFATLIDWARARPDIDKSRIFVHGGSFGGYWAARLAIVEAARLRGVIDQSGPVDLAFARSVLSQPRVLTPSFYLADSRPSITFMLGTKDGEETEDAWEAMSLRKRGLLGKPTAPMLVVGGARDPLVPVGDLWAVLTAGTKPNEAWVHPLGLHMGRVPGLWRDEELLTGVMLPWLKKQAAE